jgi:hypothetical protein
MKLPSCTSYKSYNDYGYDFDCEAIHDYGCEDCLCNYKKLGGLWNPVTGKKVNSIIAFILYGVSMVGKE